MRIVGILIITAMLSACASGLPLMQKQGEGNIKVVKGYAGCPECDKIKTYTSMPVAKIDKHITEKNFSGYLNAKVSLASSNYTKNNVPEYRVVVELTNSGAFTGYVDYWLEDANGKQHRLTGPTYGQEGQIRRMCWNNIGSGCSWYQVIQLPTQEIKNALEKNQDIKLVIGLEQNTTTSSSDGYKKTYETATTFHGGTAVIEAKSVKDFVDGLTSLGADMPTK